MGPTVDQDRIEAGCASAVPARGYDPDQFRSEASHAETEAALGMDLSSISEKQVPTWTFFADKARQQLVLFDASLPISGRPEANDGRPRPSTQRLR